jgi:flavin reductase (DIM6/NTAB) family NADH-FMN oxidoreductase RutF
MRSFHPEQHPIPFVHQLLLSGVGPRPIALVGTADADGRHNLSPFSFFNAFGANPPVVAVSPAFRGSDGSPKHTYLNILATEEFTVSAVSFAMLDQINLASSDYAAGVDEFVKASFTKLPSEKIAPPGVAESPFVMECRLLHTYETGGNAGSGNLLVGKVVCFHVSDDAYTDGKLDPRKLDLVARMGYDWYCRANGDALFELSKPRGVGVGIDALPEFIRMSMVFTGSDLARFGSLTSLPDTAALLEVWEGDIEAWAHDSSVHVLEAGSGAQSISVLATLLRELLTSTSDDTRTATLLQESARAFIASGDFDRAVLCAFSSDPAFIGRLRNRRQRS